MDAVEGTAGERINQWLDMSRDAQGHLKAGDWIAAIVPHIKLVSHSEAQPHPSATFSFTVQPEHCNRLGSLHGGCAATIYDFLTTLPIVLVYKPGFWMNLGVSRTLNVTYLRPATLGMEVLIECEIVHVGKKLATLKGTMRRKSDGAVLSTCEHGKFNFDTEHPKL